MSGLNFGILISLVDKASAPIRGFAKSLGDTSKTAKEGAKDLDKLGKDGSKAITGLGDASKAAATSVAGLGNASSLLEKSGTQAFDASARAAENFKGKLPGISAGIRELARDAEKLKKLGSSFSSLAMAGAKGMAAGMSAAGAVAGAAALAGSHESRLNQIALPLMRADGTSRLDPFKATIKNLRGITGRGELDVTDALAGALAENMSEAALKGGGAKAIMDIALANRMGERAAGELLAKAGGNFGVNAGEYAGIADYMHKAAQTGNTSFESLANTVAGMGERAKLANVGGARGLKGMALLTTQFKMSGMDDAAAGSAIDSLLRELPTLGKKVMASKSFMAGEFKSILSKHGIGDINKTLFDEKGELRGNDSADKLYNLASVFGEISENVKSVEDRLTLFKVLMPGASEEAAMRLSKEGWNSAAKAINDHLNLEEHAAKIRAESAEKWKRLTTSMKGLATAIGTSVLPAANKLMDTASAVIGKVTEWAGAHPGLVKGMALAVGAGGLLVAGVSGLVFTVGLLGNTITSTFAGITAWKGHLAGAKAWVKSLGNESLISAAKIKALDAAYNSKTLYAAYKSKARTAPLAGKAGRAGKITRAGAKVAPWAITGGTAALSMGGAGAATATGAGAATATGATVAGAGAATAGVGAAGAAGAATVATGGIAAIVVAVVVAALAAAAVLAIKYWEPIKAVFRGVWEGLKKGWDEWAGPAFTEFKFALWGIWDSISGLLDVFSPFKTRQDEVNAAFGYGASQGLGFMWMLQGVFKFATYVARAMESMNIRAANLIDKMMIGGKLAYRIANNQWGDISIKGLIDELNAANERANERWANASWSKTSERRSAWERENSQDPNIRRRLSGEAAATEKIKGAMAKGGQSGAAQPEADPGHQDFMEEAAKFGLDPKAFAQAMEPQRHTARPVATTINYNPQVTIQGAGAPAPDIDARFMALLKAHKEELASAVDEVFTKNGRWATA